MFKFILSLSFTLVAFISSASDTLHYYSGTYSDLLEDAKASQKSIMLYFHYDGCGACRLMERDVFTDSAVIQYYNTSYLVKEVNTLEEEGMEINRKYGVRTHPTFMFLNPEGETVHKIIGRFSSEKFITAGKVAANEEQGLNALQAQFDAGNREKSFLRDFAYALYDANSKNEEVVDAYISSLSKDELASDSGAVFVYEFMFFFRDQVIHFESPAFQALIAHRSSVYAHYPKEAVDHKIYMAAINDSKRALNDSNELRYIDIMDFLENEDVPSMLKYYELDGRVTMIRYNTNFEETSKLEYLLRFGSKDEVLNYMNELVPSIDMADRMLLMTIAGSVNRYSTDTQVLELANAYCPRAETGEQAYFAYLSHANILMKLSRYNEALAVVEKAIDYASTQSYDTRDLAELRSKLNVLIEEGE
ncbi:thioredoxin family protein [Phaeocystidibacter luteus]|uniref:Thioredoxin fold domain-containing protein n=1 Tax=Phaeocystidibacter luteus TaxID=911197 RepID=A0A6N6RKD8_9FLAO|nr:thioredoxin fold domain-containing protein [Phaeocystidibacter luteus]KAB2809966.1 thioredoxin fold domain-containing protein [Phaeocystidibacter luteus]